MIAPNEEERDTLVACHACDGEGTRTTERPDGTYRVMICLWCAGAGCVSKLTHAKYRRWNRIRELARRSGRCA